MHECAWTELTRQSVAPLTDHNVPRELQAEHAGNRNSENPHFQAMSPPSSPKTPDDLGFAQHVRRLALGPHIVPYNLHASCFSVFCLHAHMPEKKPE